MPVANSDESQRFLAVARAMQSETPANPAISIPDEDVAGFYRKITVPTQGVYRFEAVAGSGVRLYVNGALAIDATGPVIDEAETGVTALQTLSPGDHSVMIEVLGDDMAVVAGLVFGALGAEPRALIEVSTDISKEEGVSLAARNASIVSSGGPAGAAPDRGTGRLRLSGLGDKPAFSIGGSSSRAARMGPAEGSGSTGGSSGSTPVDGMGQMRTAALSPPMQTTSDTPSSSTSTTSSGGGTVSSVPSVNTGNTGGGTTTPTTPTAPGTPTATPTPTPAPTPTPVNPDTAPTPETVQTSPLTPPTGVEVTQAVQLTSAGNINGEVPNTGATLFGGVMSSSVFDIVNVSVSGSNRTTTVDVGPTTGQFAVRLFPEDFASGNQVQVTLTGANSASSEVEAVPVTYTVTGMPAQDGVGQALSRLTFGATPELYARVRAIGFQNYVEEQLNPDNINDAAFNSMNPEGLLSPTEDNSGQLLRSLFNYDIAHAAFSEKQLQNVMGHFWANHFHAVTKNSSIVAQNIDDRKFFRDNAFTNFHDLLLYSARSPLMSQYLDNDENRYREGRENDGINENYGREILELSTVGVEAGYTPADVDMVSRVFSGWRYERTNPNADGVAQIYRFAFFPEDHDPQDKLIPFLNTVIPGRTGAEGVQEAEELIALLANHPNTQSRTCGKLVQLLVSDSPPSNLVQACVAAWGVNGDITAMLRAILLDPSYVSNADYQRNKAKTPFEYAVSVIRTFGARPSANDDADFFRRFEDAFTTAGQAYLYFPVPTGLPEVAAAWLNSASMVAAYNKMSEVAERRQDYGIDLAADIAAAGLETAEEVASYLLAVGTADQFTLAEFDQLVGVLKGEDGIFEPLVQDETAALEKAMGLIVVSPSFQLQ